MTPVSIFWYCRITLFIDVKDWILNLHLHKGDKKSCISLTEKNMKNV